MSRHLLLIIMSFCALASLLRGSAVRPALLNGVVTYEEDGQRREIAVGKKCADLWVSPDETVIAFIGIEKAQPAAANEIEPFIEESSIYIARKLDHFKPIHLAVRAKIGGRTWKVARGPKLSPDRLTVYFFVPNTMTSWTLMRTKIPKGPYSIVADATDYCVMWGGKQSGAVIILSRRDPEPTKDAPAPGVTFPCYAIGTSGKETKLAEDCFREFDEQASRWSFKNGGTCQ
jgi:hypothetical protein